MSMSITSRTRPRLGSYPWPLVTPQIDVADIYLDSPGAAVVGREMTNMIGPLPISAVMGLIWRADEFSFVGSVSGTDKTTSDPVTMSASETLAHSVVYAEMDAFLAARRSIPTTATNYAETPQLSGITAEAPWQADAKWLAGLDTALMADVNADIVEDETENFWVRGYFDVEMFEAAHSVKISSAWDSAELGDTQKISVSLVLGAQTFTVDAIAFPTSANIDVTSASLTITATKWHTYGGKYSTTTGNLDP